MTSTVEIELPSDLWPTGDANYVGIIEESPVTVSKKLGLAILSNQGKYFFLFSLEGIGNFTFFSENLDEPMTIAVDMGNDSFESARIVKDWFGDTLSIQFPTGVDI